MKDAIPHYNRLIATKIRKTDYPDKVYKSQYYVSA
jgi:hypothetical protein